MKMALSFVSGLIVCGLILFGVKSTLPIQAQTESENVTSEDISFVELLPDIERIYQESLTAPFIKAVDKIYDDELAQFYHELIESTVLYEHEEAPN